MKISQSTLSVLKNYSTINPSIVVRPGNVLKTISPQRQIFARATVSDVFTHNFAIYELSKFLNTVSLFDQPDFEFFDDHMKISEGKNYVRYVYAAEELIVQAPDKEIVLPSKDVYFELSSKDYVTVQKALSVLGLPEISIVGEDGTIYVRANASDNPTSDTYSIAVGTTDASFNMIIKSENLKMTPRDYRVTISSRGIIEFTSDDMSYWVMTQQNSKFGI